MLTADEVAAAIEQLLENEPPGTELVVQPGRPPQPYHPTPVPR